MSSRESALSLIVLASLMNGAFALPMTRMKAWSWQSTWLLWSIFALLLLPIITLFATVAGAVQLMGSVPLSLVAQVVLLGVGWGIAQVFFGLSIQLIGLALTFSLVLGTSACAGGLLPILLNPHGHIPVSSFLLAGVAIMIAGLAMSAYAGRTREMGLQSIATASVPSAKRRPWAGIVMAISAGICASCMNLGFIAAGPLINAAERSGISPYVAATLAWVPILAGGSIPNILYCLYLAITERTLGELLSTTTRFYYVLAFLMAILWFGSSLAYGAAINLLGSKGAIWGWPAYMSLIVIVASLLGFGNGEWKGSSRSAKSWQVAGIVTLIAGVFVLSNNHV